MISVRFQGKPFNIKLIQVYAPTTNAKEAKGGWFCEDLQVSSGSDGEVSAYNVGESESEVTQLRPTL